jgi:hypothetical protein
MADINALDAAVLASTAPIDVKNNQYTIKFLQSSVGLFLQQMNDGNVPL